MSELSDALTGAGMVGIGAGQAAAAQDAFGGSQMLVGGLLAILGAQEAEKAAAWRIADIRAMQALLGPAAPPVGDGLTLSALDAAWSLLSEALIAHHAQIEAAGDKAADAALLKFYVESCARRDLVWPM